MLDPLSTNVLFNTVHRIGFCGIPFMCVGSGNGLKWGQDWLLKGNVNGIKHTQRDY